MPDAVMREELDSDSGDDSDLAVFYDAVAVPKRDVTTAEDIWQPSKRIRTKAPANGTKRNARRRVETGSLITATIEDKDTENNASATDDSFMAAAKALRPKKKLRTARLRVDEDTQQGQAGPSRASKDVKKVGRAHPTVCVNQLIEVPARQAENSVTTAKLDILQFYAYHQSRVSC